MFTKILVPVDIDYPKTAALVFQKAAEIARLSNAKIKLVTVMPGFSMPIVASFVADDIRKETIDHVTEEMEKFVADHCGGNVSFSIRSGKNWEEIVKVAEKWEADLIVVYHNHRRQINEVFSRSCSQRVADHANCSVLRLRNIRS